jgi:hypothetical protein
VLRHPVGDDDSLRLVCVCVYVFVCLFKSYCIQRARAMANKRKVRFLVLAPLQRECLLRPPWCLAPAAFTKPTNSKTIAYMSRY